MEQGLGVVSKIWDYQHTHLLKSDRENSEVVLPATPLVSYGDRAFCDEFKVRLPYIAGAMANGISSEAMVTALAKGRLLGIFGAAGLPIETIEKTVAALREGLGDLPFGVNLIHNPSEPAWEEQLVQLLFRYGITIVEASAFMTLTEALVLYRCKGLYRDRSGRVVAPHRIIGKVSRVEVAEKFMLPPPEKIVASLCQQGKLTTEEADLAREIPVAPFVTVEADSGGHTDKRSAITLFPAMLTLARRLSSLCEYEKPICLGLAGGISTPSAVASAFAMGADYVMTGSVNQACIESGTSDLVRQTLASVEQADIVMAPAADMFEMGVEVQVIKKGTMFPMRARKLYEMYKKYPSLDEIPEQERKNLEMQIFKNPLDLIWEDTKKFFSIRDPAKIQRAEHRPKLKMALIFRWYLGLSSQWANSGQKDRTLDFQVWCGPAMSAFNEWTKGSYLADPKERSVWLVALNLMLIGFALHRINILKAQGFNTESLEQTVNHPLTLSEISKILQES